MRPATRPVSVLAKDGGAGRERSSAEEITDVGPESTVAGLDEEELGVLRHVGEIYGCDTTDWRVVTRHRVDAALPAMTPPLEVRSPVTLGDGVFVCGDHRDTASIQGALVSGQRAAEAVNAHL